MSSRSASGPPPPPVVDLEEQMVLRVPEHLAVELRKMIRQAEERNSKNFETRMAFALEATPFGGATFAFGKKRYAASLVNLPTVIESYKTNDNSNYYKSADVGQMLVVHDVEKGKGRARIHTDEAGTVSSGLCPPFKGIKKRFRRTYPNKAEIAEVDNDLSRIKGGGMPGSVNIEVVEEDEDGELLDGTPLRGNGRGKRGEGGKGAKRGATKGAKGARAKAGEDDDDDDVEAGGEEEKKKPKPKRRRVNNKKKEAATAAAAGEKEAEAAENGGGAGAEPTPKKKKARGGAGAGQRRASAASAAGEPGEEGGGRERKPKRRRTKEKEGVDNNMNSNGSMAALAASAEQPAAKKPRRRTSKKAAAAAEASATTTTTATAAGQPTAMEMDLALELEASMGDELHGGPPAVSEAELAAAPVGLRTTVAPPPLMALPVSVSQAPRPRPIMSQPAPPPSAPAPSLPTYAPLQFEQPPPVVEAAPQPPPQQQQPVVPARSAEELDRLAQLQGRQTALKADLANLNKQLVQARDYVVKSINPVIKGRFTKQVAGFTEKIAVQEQALAQVEAEIAALL